MTTNTAQTRIAIIGGGTGDSYRFWDSQKLVVAFDGGLSQDPRDLRPDIDRSMLRKIMLDAVTEREKRPMRHSRRRHPFSLRSDSNLEHWRR